MSGYDDLVKEFADTEATFVAVENLTGEAEFTPDQAVKAYTMAKNMRQPIPSTVHGIEELDQNFARSQAVEAVQNPFTRNLMANRNLALMVARNPQEWSRLGALGKVAEEWARGRAQHAANVAMGSAMRKDVELDASSVYDIETEEDTATTGATDFAFLRRWSERADSPLINRAREHQQELQAGVEQARKDSLYALMDAQQALSQVSRNTVVESMQDMDAGEALWTWLQNPINVGLAVTVQSLAANAEGYAAAAAAGIAAPTLGILPVAGAIGSASFMNEYGGKALELLQESGVDTTNYDQLVAALQNKELMAEISSKALARATTVATFDALTAGIASTPVKPVSNFIQARNAFRFTKDFMAKHPTLDARLAKTYPWLPHAENLAAQTTIGAAGGAAGEYLGAKVIGEEATAADIILEALGDAFTAPADIVSLRASIARQMVDDRFAATKAIKAADVAQRTVDSFSQSELAGVAPEEVAAAVQNAVKGTDGETLTVSPTEGMTFKQELIATSPEIAERWEKAEATGGDFKISMAELVKLGATKPELVKQLIEQGRFGADAMSLAEAKAFEENFAPGLEAKVNELVTKQVEHAAKSKQRKDSAKAALKPIRDQLLAAGQDPEVVDAQMVIQQAMLEHIAELTGMTPQEWMSANPVRVEKGTKPTPSSLHQDEDTTQGEYTQPPMNPDGTVAGSALISLFNTRNPSTFLHEGAHYWLDAILRRGYFMMRNAAQTGRNRTASEEKFYYLVNDIFNFILPDGHQEKTLAEKFEVWAKLSQKEKTAAHEKFARGFEAYVRIGKEPSFKLRDAFRLVSTWLKNLYKDAAQLGVTMSPEVIDIYDRLFATEDAIADARERMSDNGLYDDLIKSKFGPEQFAIFVTLKETSYENSRAHLRARMEQDAEMANSKRAREERGLEKEFNYIKAQIREEINAMPGMRALHAFSRTGVDGKDGTKIYLKLTPEVLDDPNIPEDWKKLIRKRQMVWKGTEKQEATQQVTLDMAVDLLGFDSVEDMMTHMLGASTINVQKEVDFRSKDEFAKRHGETYSAKGLHRLASIYMHNDVRLRVLATEAAALRKAMGNASEIKKAVTAFVKESVGRIQLVRTDETGRARLLSSSDARAAARRAGRKADKAFREGRTQEAAEAKQAQLIQEATVVEIEKALALARSFEKRFKRALKSESIDGAYVEQLALLLQSFGEKIGRKYHGAPSLQEFVADHPDLMGAYQALPESLMRHNGPWQTLTIDDIRALDKFVAVLIAQGRQVKHNALNDAYAKAARMLDEVQINLKSNRAKQAKGATQTAWGPKAMGMVKSFLFQHMRFATLIRIIEGEDGPLTRAFVWRANDIDAQEKTLRQEVANRVLEIFRPLTKDMGAWNRQTIEYKGVKYSRHNIFAIALNAGNYGNLDRLNKGNGLRDGDVMHLISKLTPDELQAVQAIWDVFEDLRIKAAEVHRRIDGFEPEWVEPRSFDVTTTTGEVVHMKGGYVPIRYDPEVSDKAALRKLQTALDEEKEAGYLSAQTARTYTKARVREGEIGLAVQLDTESAFAGMHEIIHDIMWREFVSEFNRALRGVTTRDEELQYYDQGGNPVTEAVRTKHEGLSELLNDYFGSDAPKIAMDWIKQIAFDGRIAGQQAADHWASMLRRNVSIAGLGFNVVSAMVQLTGLVTASTVLGPGATLRGIARLAGNPKGVFHEVNQLSPTMALRSTTRIREIDEVSNIVVGSRNEKLELFRRAAYSMMMTVQAVVDYSVWNAAFEEAQSKGMIPEEAVHYADQVVISTQGSGAIKDRSQIEQSRVLHVFLSFYSYMGTALNLGMANYLGEKDRVKAWTRIATIFMFQPCVEAVIRSALQPGDDDDDKDKDSNPIIDGVSFVVGNSANFALGTLLFGREIAGAVGNALMGEEVYAYRGPSGVRVFNDNNSLVQQLAQKDADIGLAKASINVFGSVFGIPSAQINRIVTGGEALADDKTDNPWALLAGYKSKN